MAKKDRYPKSRRAIPINTVQRSRTSRILTPGIVFGAILILAATSLAGIIIGVSVFNSISRQTGESVSQVFTLIASSISTLYVVLHFTATLKNEPVGTIRPPTIQIHGLCFIAARLALVAWAIALIVSSVVVLKPTVCLRGTRGCDLQILDLMCSSLASLSTSVLLTALESCRDPFQIPDILHIPQTITCRVSSFGSEIFERSTRTSVGDNESVFEIQHLSAVEQPKITKPLSQRRSTIPGEYLTSPLMVQKSTARGWGEEWKHLVQATSSNAMTTSDSFASISESASYTSLSGRSSTTSVSKRASRPRIVTPSSSIGNLSRRSPLSTMRSIEFPDVPISAPLRYLPPVIAPPHEWNLSKTASLTQLLPVADIHTPQRRSSRGPASMRMMKPVTILPSDFASKFNRASMDVKVPGAFIDHYHPSLENQKKLEEHARKIEMECIAKIRGAQKVSGPVRLAGEFETYYTPNSVKSETRYRQHNRMQLSDTIAQSMDSIPDSTVFMEAVKVEYVKPPGNYVKGKKGLGHFRRLTIGDVSPELGIIWDEEMGRCNE